MEIYRRRKKNGGKKDAIVKCLRKENLKKGSKGYEVCSKKGESILATKAGSLRRNGKKWGRKDRGY